MDVRPPATFNFADVVMRETENWGADWPETLNTVVFTEENGKTKTVCTVLYESKDALPHLIVVPFKGERWEIPVDEAVYSLFPGANYEFDASEPWGPGRQFLVRPLSRPRSVSQKDPNRCRAGRV